MAGDVTDTGTLYSPAVGLVYVFNLIVGTGALTMPKAFSGAGWLLSLIMVVFLAFTSYLTVTFVIEAMAAANARIRWKKLQSLKRSGKIKEETIYQEIDNPSDESERKPLLSLINEGGAKPNQTKADFYDITERVEMGKMASMFFHRIGVLAFYVIIAIYLYGDLAIYAAAVPKSMRDVACVYRPANLSCNATVPDDELCWGGNTWKISRMNAYRVFVAAFAVLLGPFTFFNVQKTMLLQIVTTGFRWLAFGMMIVLAIIRLAEGKGEGHPVIADFSGLPNLFGVCVYSFMCHHSLPSLVAPIRDKSRLTLLFASDYSLILCFYALLSFTGIYCFSGNHFEDLYTLNFQASCDPKDSVTNVVFIQYFLALFPVFTLSTSFPIIAITLRNNLKTLCHRPRRPYPWAVDKLVFPLVTILPPIVVALVTDNVGFLVSITGSYAGAGIQYVIPVCLAYYSRKQMSNTLGPHIANKHKSPFKHPIWFILVLLWAGLCIAFVTVNHVITRQ
ncbi:transmembrane protein 104 isoform X2 [Lingula anatina]|uniref:Transmembrane protein 104 isoform X2 n=1 Tax=Lingula anatina TaxID=7574 RepID=A0A1S3HNE6_LINAN|nr:transmembrane protein 104 isoform X2 [Lingula anatina]|eukprot:XP_013387562.1 transmembrane protein 104 isoform X2 [Lingula anatina]